MALTAFSTAPKLEINDFSEFVPANKAGGNFIMVDRNTDLSEAARSVQKELLPYADREDLLEVKYRFG